jgi:hypothetical protein
MDKKLLYGIGIGAAVVIGYFLIKKPKTANFDSNSETTDKISREIKSDANVEKVQQTLPRFGVPKNIISERSFPKNSYTSFASANGFMNYVDVKNNNFFTPEVGKFHGKYGTFHYEEGAFRK